MLMLLAFVAVVAEVADVAVEAFPVNVPVIPDVTVREFNAALEPETMTFFQFGILYRLLMLWLDTNTYAVCAPTSFSGR
jgi:hypothetical protein